MILTSRNQEAQLDRFWTEFKEDLKNRSLRPPENPADLGADFASFLGDRYPQPRRRQKRTTDPAPISADLPKELKRRQSEWIDAQLQRANDAVVLTREALGFGGTPYPKDEKLADAFIGWAAEITGASKGPRRPGRIYLSIDRVGDDRLRDALRRLNPPVYVRSERFDNAETQVLAYESAVERFVHECEGLCRTLGTDITGAARWILAGLTPKGVCIDGRLLQQMWGPDIVTMKINPNVVTAEEVRTIYRRLARVVKRPIDQKIRSFFQPHEGNQGRTVKERLALWNERYPLHPYKDEATFRVVTSRALRATGRTPSGSLRAKR